MYSRKNYIRRKRRMQPYARRSAYQVGNAVANPRRVVMRTNIRRRMMKVKPSGPVLQYVKAILNPSTLGVRVPDEFAGPTSVFQLEQEFIVKCDQTQTTGGNVVMAFELGTLPHFVSYGSSAGRLATGGAYSGNATAGSRPTASSQLIGGPSSGTLENLVGPTYLGSSSDLFTLLNLYKGIRMVSAGIKVQYAGTDSSNQGVLSIAYMNREFFENREEIFNFDSGNTVATYQRKAYITSNNNYFDATTITALGTAIRSLPVNAFGPAKDGCVGRYVPLDAKDCEFRSLIPAAVGTVNNVSSSVYSASNAYAAGDPVAGTLFSNPFLHATSQVIPFKDCGSAASWSNYGAFIITGENLSTSSTGGGAVFVVKCVVNYEGIVKDEALNLVSSSASPCVSSGFAKAGKIYGKKWQVKVGSEHDQGH